MRYEIELNGIAPVSLNNYKKMTNVGGKPRVYKPKESVLFDSKVTNELRAIKSLFTRINSTFDSNKHYLTIDYNFYMPVLTKKKDRVSKTSKDVDNIVKPLQDLLFKNLNADDSEIISINSTKIHSDELCIKVVIYIRDLKHIL